MLRRNKAAAVAGLESASLRLRVEVPGPRTPTNIIQRRALRILELRLRGQDLDANRIEADLVERLLERGWHSLLTRRAGTTDVGRATVRQAVDRLTAILKQPLTRQRTDAFQQLHHYLTNRLIANDAPAAARMLASLPYDLTGKT